LDLAGSGKVVFASFIALANAVSSAVGRAGTVALPQKPIAASSNTNETAFDVMVALLPEDREGGPLSLKAVLTDVTGPLER
jgi:hypothetical protein